MSQGAQNAIREIMEYMGDQSEQQIDESQLKILDAIKTLEAEGKISSYKRSDSGGVYIMESQDVSSDAARNKIIEKTSQSNQPAPQGDMSEYLNAGIDSYNSQDYEQAISYLRYVVENNPDEATAWQYLGSTYYAVQNYQEAVSSYENYVRLSNDSEFEKWLDDLKKQLGM
jgi:tetratricopeptide (TPR) repeat protein